MMNAIITIPPDVEPEPPPPLPEGVLGPPEYLGALRLSLNAMAQTEFTYGGLAGRNDGGTIKLYITGNSAGPEAEREWIIEVIDPGSGYNTNYLVAPVATTNFYTNAYREKRYTWRVGAQDPDFFPQTPAANGGLHWDETNNLLYICYYDTYDVTASQTHGLLAVQLVPNGDPPNGATIGYGPWSIQTTDGDGQTKRGPRSCMYLTRHLLTNEMVVGATLTSGNASTPWGPSLFTGVNLPTAATPVGQALSITAPDLGLYYYYMGFGGGQGGGYQLTTAGLLQPGKSLRSFRRRLDPGIYEYFGGGGEGTCAFADDVLNVDPALYQDALGFTGSWRDLEFVHGMLYVQIGDEGVYLYAASLVDGHSWYQNECKPVCPSHGISSASPGITGPVTTSAFPAFIGYDPAVIQQVLDGTLLEWQAEAAYEVNLDTEHPGFRTAPVGTIGAAKTISMGYFDATTRKLFIHAPRADNSRFGPVGSLIHVFQWPEP